MMMIWSNSSVSVCISYELYADSTVVAVCVIRAIASSWLSPSQMQKFPNWKQQAKGTKTLYVSILYEVPQCLQPSSKLYRFWFILLDGAQSALHCQWHQVFGGGDGEILRYWYCCTWFQLWENLMPNKLYFNVTQILFWCSVIVIWHAGMRATGKRQRYLLLQQCKLQRAALESSDGKRYNLHDKFLMEMHSSIPCMWLMYISLGFVWRKSKIIKWTNFNQIKCIEKAICEIEIFLWLQSMKKTNSIFVLFVGMEMKESIADIPGYQSEPCIGFCNGSIDPFKGTQTINAVNDEWCVLGDSFDPAESQVFCGYEIRISAKKNAGRNWIHLILLSGKRTRKFSSARSILYPLQSSVTEWPVLNVKT